MHLNQKRLLCLIGVWCFMFGHLLLLVRSGRRLLLGGDVFVTVVVDSSMPMPSFQDLSWRVISFVWNLRLTREEVAFYIGVSLTWTVECYPRGDTKIRTQPLLLIARVSTQTK